MAFMKEFREFAIKGNMVDLAVGVIIGAAFGRLVDSLVKDLIMPVISRMVGGLDFSNWFFVLGSRRRYNGPMTLTRSPSRRPTFRLRQFSTVTINFVILGHRFPEGKAITPSVVCHRRRTPPSEQIEPARDPDALIKRDFCYRNTMPYGGKR